MGTLKVRDSAPFNFIGSAGSTLDRFITESTTKALRDTVSKQTRVAGEQEAEHDTERQTIGLSQNTSAALEQEHEHTEQVIADSLADENALSQRAIADLDGIVSDQKKIDDDNAIIAIEDARIKEDDILIGCTLGTNGPAWDDRRSALHIRSAAEDDRDAAAADQSAKKADLAIALAALAKINTQGLSSLIDDLFKTISKAIKLLIGTDGKVGEGDFEKASALIAQVMSIVQMIASKVQQLRSGDQQWLSRVNLAEGQMATNKAESIAHSMDKLEEIANLMQKTMTVIQDVGFAISAVIAVASGGSGLAIFALMVALQQTGAMTKLTDALTGAIGDLCGKKGAIWEKIMADVVIAMILVAVTRQVTPATRAAAANVTEQVTQEEVEIEMTEMASKTANSTGTVANLGTGTQATAAEAKAASTRSVESAAKASTQEEIKRNLGLGVMYFGANNGVVDLAEFSYAASQKEANASKEELQKEHAEIMMIIDIVSAVMQAFAEMAGAKYGMNTQEGGSTVEQILGKLQNLKLMLYAQGVQAGSMIVSGAANGALAINTATQSQFTKEMGEINAILSRTQSLGQAAKLFERKQIELFASKLEQQIQALSMMIRKNGQAEMAAARILEQSAV